VINVESQSKVEKELNKHNRGKAIRSRLKSAFIFREKERRREGEKERRQKKR
jgi:hypothetical protein